MKMVLANQKLVICTTQIKKATFSKVALSVYRTNVSF